MNSNRRVIGSIVKKTEKIERKSERGIVNGESKKMKKNTGAGRRNGKKGSSRGPSVLIIFYPKTAPSLRRAILLICKGVSEKWGGKE